MSNEMPHGLSIDFGFVEYMEMRTRAEAERECIMNVIEDLNNAYSLDEINGISERIHDALADGVMSSTLKESMLTLVNMARSAMWWKKQCRGDQF